MQLTVPSQPVLSTGSLSGIRVVELGSFIAGPFATQLLADHGAEVLKVEHPLSGDPMREWGTVKKNDRSLWWPVIGRNKKSVAIDLKDERGRALVEALLAEADVLVENFRPGVLERLGFAPNSLWRRNPGLVITRISGYGQDGPYSERAGFGGVAEAMAGLRFLNGFADRPPPRLGVSIADSLTGLLAAFGTMSALWARQTTGRGQIVDVGLTDAVLAVMESVLTEYSATGAIRQRSGTILPNVAPSNIYPTQDDRFIAIGANADGPFRRLAKAMDRSDLADDPRYASHQARGQRQEELDAVIGAWTRQHTLAELSHILHEQGVPAGPVNRADEIIADEHFRERGAIARVSTADGDVWMQNVAPKLSGTPGEIRWAGPELGAHTHEVLHRLLGLREDEINALQDDAVIRIGNRHRPERV